LRFKLRLQQFLFFIRINSKGWNLQESYSRQKNEIPLTDFWHHTSKLSCISFRLAFQVVKLTELNLRPGMSFKTPWKQFQDFIFFLGSRLSTSRTGGKMMVHWGAKRYANQRKHRVWRVLGRARDKRVHGGDGLFIKLKEAPAIPHALKKGRQSPPLSRNLDIDCNVKQERQQRLISGRISHDATMP
jgi:hypothetical protein